MAPPGSAVDEIATRRPFEDPGAGHLYYRFVRRVGPALSKTHMAYPLDARRLELYRTLFLKPDYVVDRLPGYEPEVGANPFRAFAAIPVRSRNRFMLAEAEFTIMGFIKGPVCRGQIALNVIQDRWAGGAHVGAPVRLCKAAPIVTERRRSRISRIVELIAAIGGVGLLWFAWHADARWFERHLLLCFMGIPDRVFWIARHGRAIVVGLGIFTLVIGRPWWGRRVAQRSIADLFGSALRTCLAVVLSLGVCEAALRWREHGFLHPKSRAAPGALAAGDLRARSCESHPRCGWLYRPSQTLTGTFGGRNIRFAIDARSNRAASQTSEADRARPTILFVGESVMAGQGLQYEETLPAIVGARLGVQAVNLGVVGYGCDQAYLRLVDELPSYERPIAVVTLFMPAMMGRALARWRPHLELDEQQQLVVVPPTPLLPTSSRLLRFLEDEAPYWSDRFIDRTMELTRHMFRDTAARARARGAYALFVIPRYGGGHHLDDPFQAEVLQHLLGSQGIDFIVVDVDPRWVIPGDGHPDARAAEQIGTAITNALRAARVGTEPARPLDRATTESL